MSRTARTVALGLAAVTALVPAALATAQEAPADPKARAAAGKTVTLRNVAFSPKTVRISKGQTVTFSWRDNGIVHNVTPVGRRSFKFVVKGKTRSTASERRSGKVTTTTFKRAGTYNYACTIHAVPDDNGRFPAGSMVGKIVVK